MVELGVLQLCSIDCGECFDAPSLAYGLLEIATSNSSALICLAGAMIQLERC